jgi:NAD-specific glutamate dehydrogenase
MGRAHLQARLREHPIGKRRIEVVTTERRIAARGNDFEHTLRQTQQRDVERATAQVVDRVQAFGRVVQAVGNSGGGRLVDQAQHIQASELRSVFRRLALRVIEVGRHGDHGAEQVIGVEAVFGALAQRSEDLGRDLDRRLHTISRVDRHHARLVDEAVRQALAPGNVGERAAHQSLG